ncbi:MAG: Transposase DDE domain protein [Bacteroidetes bacterium ADurb.BinA174]|nr:MAG: Transposase DDE domain protein [Bacteroidetes bacterium ADurb.BinA174]
MTINNHPNTISLINSVLIANKFSFLKASRKKFILTVFLYFLSIKDRINFLQLERFSDYSEQYFRIHFENKFDFQSFNLSLIQQQDINACIIAFAPSYIPKSGKSTFGVNKYWSGCSKQAKWGLDICGFAAVDVNRKTAFHLNAVQTPPLENMTLLVHYCSLLVENHMYFKELSNYLVADAYFSKAQVVETALSLDMHFISRLRDDVNLKYIYRSEKTGKPGAPKKYDGKVNPRFPDMNHFSKIVVCDELTIYSAEVYSVAFDRNINLAIAVFSKDGKEMARKLYFSTDPQMNAEKIVKYCRSRFQIEFIYRDTKQHCGLTHCQARSRNKLDFHFNAALTAVNLAKIEWLQSNPQANQSFSMSDYKTMYSNDLLLKVFIRKFGINPNTKKNKLIINELRNYAKVAV